MVSGGEKHITFFEHLGEFRSRLIRSLVVLGFFSCLLFNTSETVLQLLIHPVGRVVFSTPTEAFSVRIILSLCSGFIVSMPFLLYELWQFVALALAEKEKRYVVVFIPLSFAFFACGCLFAYVVMLPVMLRFFLSFATPYLAPMITVGKYISFIVTVVLSMGLMFEFPLVVAFLTKIGIATPAFLTEKRRHAIVWIFVISAVLTPSPDMVSQILMAGPLIVLYEVSIIFSRFVLYLNERKEKPGLDGPSLS